MRMNFRFFLIIFCVLGTSVLNTGCGCNSYIEPNYREFTTGGIFADKYWNEWTGSSCVKLAGTFKRVDTTVLSGVERLIMYIDVPDGLRSVTVYAARSFATQLYNLKSGEKITVYGTTISIMSSSREDQGFTGGKLAVELDKLDRQAVTK